MAYLSTDVPKDWGLKTLFVIPYQEASYNFFQAFFPKKEDAAKRGSTFKHIIACVGLAIPLINTIVLIALRHFALGAHGSGKKPVPPQKGTAKPQVPKATPHGQKAKTTPLKGVNLNSPAKAPAPAPKVPAKALAPKLPNEPSKETKLSLGDDLFGFGDPVIPPINKKQTAAVKKDAVMDMDEETPEYQIEGSKPASKPEVAKQDIKEKKAKTKSKAKPDVLDFAKLQLNLECLGTIIEEFKAFKETEVDDQSETQYRELLKNAYDIKAEILADRGILFKEAEQGRMDHLFTHFDLDEAMKCLQEVVYIEELATIIIRKADPLINELESYPHAPFTKTVFPAGADKEREAFLERANDIRTPLLHLRFVLPDSAEDEEAKALAALIETRKELSLLITKIEKATVNATYEIKIHNTIKAHYEGSEDLLTFFSQDFLQKFLEKTQRRLGKQEKRLEKHADDDQTTKIQERVDTLKKREAKLIAELRNGNLGTIAYIQTKLKDNDYMEIVKNKMYSEFRAEGVAKADRDLKVDARIKYMSDNAAKDGSIEGPGNKNDQQPYECTVYFNLKPTSTKIDESLQLFFCNQTASLSQFDSSNFLCSYFALFNSLQAVRLAEDPSLAAQNPHLDRKFFMECFTEWAMLIYKKRVISRASHQDTLKTPSCVDIKGLQEDEFKYLINNSKFLAPVRGKNIFLLDLTVYQASKRKVTEAQYEKIKQKADKFGLGALDANEIIALQSKEKELLALEGVAHENSPIVSLNHGKEGCPDPQQKNFFILQRSQHFYFFTTESETRSLKFKGEEAEKNRDGLKMNIMHSLSGNVVKDIKFHDNFRHVAECLTIAKAIEEQEQNIVLN